MSLPAAPPAPRRLGWGSIFLRVLLLLGILAFGFLATHFPPFDRWLTKERLIEALEVYRNSPNAGALHALLFTAFACTALPVTPLMLAAGYLFGFAWGALYNWLGSVIGALAAYGVARWLGGEAIEALLRRRIGSFRNAGFRTTLWLRAIPVFPYVIVNFGAGAAKVPFGGFALATALGMLPSCVSFTLFAYAAGEVWVAPTPENVLLFALAIGVGALGFLLPFWMHRRRKRFEAARAAAESARDSAPGA
ncbi:MAG: VTT domain-containing protein [Planctomycetes bacterium]|nr:VTT domain-containing protein [Planctomycetota bacterium]